MKKISKFEAKNTTIDDLLGKTLYSFEKFHKDTKISLLDPQIPSSEWPEEWKKIYFKAYSRFEEISLPSPDLGKVTFKEVLEKRSSKRIFSSDISKKELSNLLYYGAGLNKTKSNSRFYPSAGGRYPLEVYFISINTELPRSLYHYCVKNNSMERLFTFDRKLLKSFFNQDWVKHAAGLIIITSVFKRNVIKYGDRGYRHILTEAGCMTQNFYLLCGALGISCCGIGGYLDDEINSYLDIDGLKEAVVGVIAVG
ncbi:MAG: SagB/ThcOx family dehydrogenase [Candidatus Levybacteria bacterium]|nr:SagB/ThcOx family dehydrogenase [Candidatus Levybacteria bacterium]